MNDNMLIIYIAFLGSIVSLVLGFVIIATSYDPFGFIFSIVGVIGIIITTKFWMASEEIKEFKNDI